MLRNINSYDPKKTVVFIWRPIIYYGLRQIMYYLPEFRVYQLDIPAAPTGEVRKIFWGINRETLTKCFLN